jgi:hypothetical protein
MATQSIRRRKAPAGPRAARRASRRGWLAALLFLLCFASLTYIGETRRQQAGYAGVDHGRYVRWAAERAALDHPMDATPLGPIIDPDDPWFAAPAAAAGHGAGPLFADLADPMAFTKLVEGYPGRPRNDIRAVYLSGGAAGDPGFMRRMVDLVKTSNLNALVIDVKDNTGRTTYMSRIPAVQAAGATSNRIADLQALFRMCEEQGIYTIGRLVMFADPVLAAHRPDLAIQTPTGSVWVDHTRHGWTNPYATEVWAYNLAIAAEVASLGCREIQFDYVRFPSDGRMDLVTYPIKTDQRPAEVIEAFLSQARRELAPYGVYTAADVFGLVTSFGSDMRIGQVLENVARQVDFVCPMMYPSHYALGNYGLPDPDAAPYDTIRIGLGHAKARLRGWEDVLLRPWLQDFSWRHRYGEAQVRAQIQAAAEHGVHGYMLWNARNVYTEDAVR